MRSNLIERLKRLEERAKSKNSRCQVIDGVRKTEEQIRREVEALHLRPGDIVVIVDK